MRVILIIAIDRKLNEGEEMGKHTYLIQCMLILSVQLVTFTILCRTEFPRIEKLGKPMRKLIVSMVESNVEQ